MSKITIIGKILKEPEIEYRNEIKRNPIMSISRVDNNYPLGDYLSYPIPNKDEYGCEQSLFISEADEIANEVLITNFSLMTDEGLKYSVFAHNEIAVLAKKLLHKDIKCKIKGNLEKGKWSGADGILHDIESILMQSFKIISS